MLHEFFVANQMNGKITDGASQITVTPNSPCTSVVTTTPVKGGTGGHAEVASMIVGSWGSHLHNHVRRHT